MTTTANNEQDFFLKKHRGPHPAATGIVHAALFIAALVSFGICSHGAAFPTPFLAPEVAQKILLGAPLAIRLHAFFLFGSAVPLGIFTAAVTSRLSFLGVNVTGVSIGLVGGVIASVCMVASGLCMWVLSQPGVATEVHVMHTVQLLAFATGGVAYIVFAGLLMAGVAIPCLLGRYTPSWVAWLGIVLAVIAELSFFGLLFFPLSYLLPLVRYGSFVWMIATGFTLKKQRA